MTPFEYQARLDEILRYVGHLLTYPAGTAEWEVARGFALLSDSDRMRYLREVIKSDDRRTKEIGWDLRAILLGWPEAGAAA